MNSFIPIIFFALLSACSSGPNSVEYIAQGFEEKNREIYIASHGWHTGFVIPAELIQEYLPQLKERFNHTPYLEFGWGDKGFYQAKEITAGLTLKALFWPTETVIHAVAVPQTADKYFSNSEVSKVCLKKSQYQALVQFIANSFKKNQNNKIIPLKKGIYGNSQFYQSLGDFYFLNTCNKWTAKGLQSAGMDISPNFKLTADSIMKYLTTQSNCLNEHSK